MRRAAGAALRERGRPRKPCGGGPRDAKRRKDQTTACAQSLRSGGTASGAGGSFAFVLPRPCFAQGKCVQFEALSRAGNRAITVARQRQNFAGFPRDAASGPNFFYGRRPPCRDSTTSESLSECQQAGYDCGGPVSSAGADSRGNRICEMVAEPFWYNACGTSTSASSDIRSSLEVGLARRGASPAALPVDALPVAEEAAGGAVLRQRGAPDDTARALFDGTVRVLAAHPRAHPAGPHGIDEDAVVL